MSQALQHLRRKLGTPFEDPFYQSLERILNDDFFLTPGGKELKFSPKTEIEELPEGYQIQCDVPGLNKDDIHIELHQNQLTISGKRREERKEEKNRKHVSEIYYGSFMRHFTLPSQVNSEKVEANYDQGVLRIFVPKSEPSQGVRIQIR